MTKVFIFTVGQASAKLRRDARRWNTGAPCHCGASFSIYAPSGRSRSQKPVGFLESSRGALAPPVLPVGDCPAMGSQISLHAELQLRSASWIGLRPNPCPLTGELP